MEKINYNQYMSLNKKVKNIYSKKTNFSGLPKVSYIKSLVKKITNEGLTELKDIKEYFAKNKDKVTNKNINIVTSIINAKQEGKKIYLNTGLFGKPLNLYFSGSNIKTKCLTNELLNLMMNFTRLYNLANENNDLFRTSKLASVKITSSNFYLDETTVRGYIQDYDSDFSAIAAPNFPKGEITSIVRDKPNKGEFELDGVDYMFYGTSDVYFVTLESLTNESAIEKFNFMKYLRNKRDGQFVLGERKVYLSGDDKLCYIDKDIIPEKFCPAFWISDKEISLNYLFTFEIDYNELFDKLAESETQGSILFPSNMCYWDTINECFQFLSVFSITHNFSKEDNRINLIEWCDTYFTFKSIIALWKNNQLLYQRILQDFLYAFLNNSDLKRFMNLLEKVNKYIAVRDELKKNPYSSDVTNFFNTIPFAQMITKQFNPEVMGLADKIRIVLLNYLDGKKPNSIIDDVRSIAKSIQAYTSSVNIKDATFPFIIAEGGILGNEINFNVLSSDPLFRNVFQRVQQIIANKQKGKEKIDEMTDLLSNYDVILTSYLEQYTKNYLVRNKIDKRGIPITPVISQIRKAMKNDLNSSKKVIEEAMKLRSLNKPLSKNAKIVFLDNVIADHLEKRDKNSNVDVKMEISDDEEEDEKEDAKSEQIQTRYNLRNRKK